MRANKKWTIRKVPSDLKGNSETPIFFLLLTQKVITNFTEPLEGNKEKIETETVVCSALHQNPNQLFLLLLLLLFRSKVAKSR